MSSNENYSGVHTGKIMCYAYNIQNILIQADYYLHYLWTLFWNMCLGRFKETRMD